MQKPDNLLTYAAERLGFPVDIGAHVRMDVPCMGTGDDDEEHTTTVGAHGLITNIRWLDRQGLAICIEIDTGNDAAGSIVNTFDERDRDPQFPFHLAEEHALA